MRSIPLTNFKVCNIVLLKHNVVQQDSTILFVLSNCKVIYPSEITNSLDLYTAHGCYHSTLCVYKFDSFGTLYKHTLFGLSFCENAFTIDTSLSSTQNIVFLWLLYHKTLWGLPAIWPLSPFQTQHNFLSVSCESVNCAGK